MQFSQFTRTRRTGVQTVPGLTAIVAIGAIVLLPGCGGGSSSRATPGGGPVVLTPVCSNPAPLEGRYSEGHPTYIVDLVPGTVSAEQAPLLGAKYGFTPKYIYSFGPYFAAEFSPEALARLRCDPLVVRVYYDIPLLVDD